MNLKERKNLRDKFVAKAVSMGASSEEALKKFDEVNPIICFKKKRVAGKLVLVMGVILLALIIGFMVGRNVQTAQIEQSYQH